MARLTIKPITRLIIKLIAKPTALKQNQDQLANSINK